MTRCATSCRIVGLHLFAWLVITISPVSAQFERYELGRRVKGFEIAWDQVEDEAARAKASQSLKAAVNSFFSFRLDNAARAITEGQFALRRNNPPTDIERWAASLCMKPESRLIDASTKALALSIEPFYSIDGKIPQEVILRLGFEGAANRVEEPIKELPLKVELPIQAASGDQILVCEIVHQRQVLATISAQISLVEKLNPRLESLNEIIADWADSATADRESVKNLMKMLESLASKQTLELDVAADRLLMYVEAQGRSADRSEPFLGKDRTGQAWVTLVTKSGRRAITRVFVPETAKRGEPIPLVVALHGAGGSENLFFEAYGHGAIVDLCRERGWLLVAPRSSPFGTASVPEVVDAVAAIYPVDLKRVVLVGHSMGAAQSVAAASNDPTRFAAVAALGGGGSVRAQEALKALPFLIGIGTDDFALRGAKSLNEGLKKAEVASVTYREYPGIEHFAIVQVALKDVFAFFDRKLATSQSRKD